MAVISVCIPTRKGSGKIDYVYPYYNRQIYKDYEIVIYNDEFGSAAKARNYIAKNLVSSDVEYLLFVGDDCIPDRSLTYRYQHFLMSNPEVDVVQGFTPFHPSVMDTYFMHFLDRSGIQANWYALLDKDKNWKKDATGFCLTTNFLIRKSLFEKTGGFREEFPGAAWEDVEFGERLNQMGIKTRFLPSAINYHWHKYKFTEYIKRQITEGKNRVVLATLRPDAANSVLNVDGIRAAKNQLGARLEITNKCINMLNSARELTETREYIDTQLRNALNLFSFFGVIDAIQNTPYMVLEYCKDNMSSVHVASAIKSIEDNNYAYSLHCAGWLNSTEKSSWYSLLFEAYIHAVYGQKEKALSIFNRLPPIESTWRDFVKSKIE